MTRNDPLVPTEAEYAVIVASRSGVVADVTATLGRRARIRARILVLLLISPDVLGEAPIAALRVRGANIVGSFNLGSQRISCPVALEDCTFDKPVVLSKARLPNMSLRGSSLRGLKARHVVIEGTLNLAEGFECRGLTKLFGAQMTRLEAVGGRFLNGRGTAIDGNYLRVDGYATLENARIEGLTTMLGAVIEGQLDFTGAIMSSDLDYSIELDSATVAGGVEFKQVQIEGGVWLVGLRATGELAFHGAIINAPHRRAIDASASILGSIILSHANISGDVKVAGSRLRVLDCTDTSLTRSENASLDLDGSILEGPFHAHFASITGMLDLTNVTMETYRDKKSSWPRSARLIGASYHRIEGDEDTTEATKADLDARLDWIKLDDRYHPQKYAAVATAYRNVGRSSFATHVLMAAHREEAKAKDGADGILAKILSTFLRWTVGYGYRLRRALGWLIVLIAGGSLLLEYADESGFVRAKETGGPGLNPILLAVDLLFPVVSLGQAEAFSTLGWAQWLAASMSVLGWLLAAAVVAALAGVLQRQRD